MARGIFANLSSRPQPPNARHERVEPRLLPSAATGGPTALQLSPPPVAAIARHPASAPIVGPGDRPFGAPGKHPAGGLRLAVLAGCAVFALAGAGGAAFVLLSTPRRARAPRKRVRRRPGWRRQAPR